MNGVHRMHRLSEQTSPIEGLPVWSPVKSVWFSGMATIALVGGVWTFAWDAAVVSCLLTIVTLCLGHSIGFHRLLIHRSFECPRWLEYSLVYLGVVVGMGGPRRIIYLHDIRDWSQRHSECHPFYIHSTPIWLDWFWQMHCELKLRHPPDYRPDEPISGPLFYRVLDRTWMLQQLPLALCLAYFGGWAWVVWGICVRVTISLSGHWLVGYIAHNAGPLTWIVAGAAVQGHNVPGLGLITMGEAWHNNHHAFPESARLGLDSGQNDPGWWAISLLRRVGLVRNIRLPQNLPERKELCRVVGSSADELMCRREEHSGREHSGREHSGREHSGREHSGRE
ncbi:MAG: acyl-CoA desaturase, partial [Planctomycetales bacterium]